MLDSDTLSMVSRFKKRYMDASACEHLFSRYYPQAIRFACSILRDGDAASDAVHNAFIKAFTHIGQLKDNAKFETWFMSIVHNEAIQILRTIERERPVAQDGDVIRLCDRKEDEQSMQPEGQLEQEETETEMKLSLAELKPKQKEVLVLKYYFLYSGEEIAKILHIPSATVRSRIARDCVNKFL